MADITPQIPPAVSSSRTVASISRHTRWLLVVYYLLAEVWGVRNIWYWEPSRLDILMPLALAVALGWWAVVDGKHRGQAIPMFAQKWFVLLAVILAPAYVIWSRGWRVVGWLVLHSVLWIALATVFTHVGGVLIFGEEWLRAHGL